MTVQNVIQLPAEIYEEVRRQAAKQDKTPDILVTEWVASHLNVDNSGGDESLAAFEQEIAAFESMKPKLMKEFPGQYVAVHGGEVVASGDDKLEVSREVREHFGPVVYYVEKVSTDSPRRVRMPSVRVSRK